MKQLIRDPELEHFLPAVSAAAEKELESQLIEEGGPRDPIRVWGNIILDGHRRHAICLHHNLPFRIEEIKLPNRNAAKRWMARYQLGRRNLTTHQESVCIAALSRLHQEEAPNIGKTKLVRKVAAESGRCVRTVHRATRYMDSLESLPSDIRECVLDFHPSRGDVIALASLEPKEIRRVWNEYCNGDYASIGSVIRGEKPDEEHKREKKVRDRVAAATKNEMPSSDSDGKDSEVSATIGSDTVSPPQKGKSGQQKVDPRAFGALESALGKCLRDIDTLHHSYPAPKFHRDMIELVGDAMEALTCWREAVK